MSLKHLLSYCVYLVFTCELLFQGLALLVPSIDLLLSNRYGMSLLLDDPVTEVRLNPYYAGHDGLGYRNKSVISNPDIVILGDSMVYGIVAPDAGAWPQQLGQMTGLQVYNMGVPATGPGHYFHRLNEALSLKPSMIVTAIYTGNDIWGSYRACYLLAIPKLRCPSKSAEKIKNGKEAKQIFDEETAKTAPLVGYISVADDTGSTELPNPLETVGSLIRDHSKLWGLLRLFKSRLYPQTPKNQEPSSRIPKQFLEYLNARIEADEGLSWYVDGTVRTVLHPSYRSLGLDKQGLLAIEEGVDLTKNIILQIDTKVRSAGVVHHVLIIPTKETIYQPYVSKNNYRQAYQTLFQNEGEIINALKIFMETKNIEYSDITTSMREGIDANTQIYPQSAQSHPNSNGYRIIVKHLMSELKTAL